MDSHPIPTSPIRHGWFALFLLLVSLSLFGYSLHLRRQDWAAARAAQPVRAAQIAAAPTHWPL